MKKIYILHGWTYSTERWEPFVSELRKNGFDTIFLKIPGLTSPIDRVWDIDDYVHWLNKILANEKEKVILLGHSNGGLITLSYTLKFPQKVKQIILIDSTGIYHNELGIRIKRSVFMIAAKVGKKFITSPFSKKFLYKLARAHDYENANPIMKKTMVNLIKTDLIEKFDSIETPTLIVWGEKDQVTPLNDGKVMNSRIINSKLYIVPDARHSPQLTHSKQVAEYIIKNL